MKIWKSQMYMLQAVIDWRKFSASLSETNVYWITLALFAHPLLRWSSICSNFEWACYFKIWKPQGISYKEPKFSTYIFEQANRSIFCVEKNRADFTMKTFEELGCGKENYKYLKTEMGNSSLISSLNWL